MISPFNKRLTILSDVYLHYREDDEFKEFADYNDLGLPLAHVCASGLADIKPDGIVYIEETYDLLIDTIDASTKLEYTETRLISNSKQQIWLIQRVGEALKNDQENDYTNAIELLRKQSQH